MKILVADDHRLIREGLKPLLARLADAVAIVEAWDAQSLALAVQEHADLDLALVDLDMPGMQGPATIGRLRTGYPTLPIVVVSGFTERSGIEQLLALGTSGFIPKSSSIDVTLQAIRLVLAGGQYLPPQLLGAVPAAAAAPAAATPPPEARLAAGVPASSLSARQQQVLALLATGLPNKAIARELGVSPGTIKAHLVQIFRVLGVHNRVSAVIAARNLLNAAAASDRRDA